MAAATAPAIVPPKAKTVRASFVIGLLLALALLAFIVVNAIRQENSNSARAFSQPHLPLGPQLHRVTIGTGAITVNASNYSYFTMPVPAGASNVSVQGHFTATGGSGNDIEGYLLSQEQYTNWQNGRPHSDVLQQRKGHSG